MEGDAVNDRTKNTEWMVAAMIGSKRMDLQATKYRANSLFHLLSSDDHFVWKSGI